MNTQQGPSPSYLLVGSGRAAKHLSYYLDSLNIRYKSWHRRSSEKLEELANNISHVLLLINDDAIDDFYNKNSCLHHKVCVHFSGSLQSKNVKGLHPLYTFGPQLYSSEVYPSIPFVGEEGGPTLQDVFPQFKNPFATLPAHKKALYHSYCTMSGNFTTILWQNIFKDFEKDLGLSQKLLLPYMTQIFSNLMSQSTTALTGPLARNDRKTILLHLDALMGRSYQSLYYSFISFFEKSRRQEGLPKRRSIFGEAP